MKPTQPKLKSFCQWLALLLGAGALLIPQCSSAQEARFFRIAGPVAATSAQFDSAGYVTWTNVPTNATFTVQCATELGNWVDYVQIPVTNGINVSRLIDLNPPAGMTLVPAGSFTMGDATDGTPEELPLHTVYVSACYLDKLEVTKALWDEVYQWAISHGYSFENAGAGKAADHPVQSINWFDMVKWCNARSERDGKTPAYYTEAAQTTVYRAGRVAVENDWVNWTNGYRLPTEAEWEKASRGGLSGQRFSWGNTIAWIQANYYAYPESAGGLAYDVNPTPGYHETFAASDPPYTSPVGYFAPGGYGVYDQSGNVWEWCWDNYANYDSADQTDPHGSATGSGRVLRGGGWDDIASSCRSAFRSSIDPAYNYFSIGFRTVLPARAF